jgi:hypothetical protein
MTTRILGGAFCQAFLINKPHSVEAINATLYNVHLVSVS